MPYSGFPNGATPHSSHANVHEITTPDADRPGVVPFGVVGRTRSVRLLSAVLLLIEYYFYHNFIEILINNLLSRTHMTLDAKILDLTPRGSFGDITMQKVRPLGTRPEYDLFTFAQKMRYHTTSIPDALTVMQTQPNLDVIITLPESGIT